MDWLTKITQQHKDLEAPASFYKWSAIAAISAVVKDNIWIDRSGVFKTYPNIYVMLHAESGLKKGPPINMAKQLVNHVNNTRVFTGRASIQGILKEMGAARSKPGGIVETKAVAFICSSELSSSIVEDKVATKILTDLYDRSYNEGDWASLLKMENFKLKDPTITMLTATNEAMSDDFFTRSAIQGGYFARTFIVYEKENTVINSLVYPLEFVPNYERDSGYLKELALLRGPFKPIAQLIEDDEYKFKKIKQGREIWFNHTGEIYDSWYEDFRATIKTQEVKDDTGTLNRFGDSVLKVAMLLSLAMKPVLEITPDAMNMAIKECEKLVGNVRKTTMGKQGLSQSSPLKSLIIMELLNRETHQVTRAVLMKKYWMHYQGSEEFDGLMASFESAGIVESHMSGNMIIYTMPESQVLEYKKFMEGKMRK